MGCANSKPQTTENHGRPTPRKTPTSSGDGPSTRANAGTGSSHFTTAAQKITSPIVGGAALVGKGAMKGVETVGKGANYIGRRLSAVGAFLDPSNALVALRPVSDNIRGRAHHVKNIFAKPLEALLKTDSYKPPVHPKSDEERQMIYEALHKNFVFDNLSNRELKPMVDAFEKISAAKGEVIINQGDAGDFFYIVMDGECEFLINDSAVGTVGRGNSFGELALLYTCPRAATVRALTPVALFRVDQLCFRFILKSVTEKGQSEKYNLLQRVEFLKDLPSEDQIKLGKVMTPLVFHKGEQLVRKGDIGYHFYIIKEGTVKVSDIGDGSSKYEDVFLKDGDYFGERALVTGEPRMANITADTDGLAFVIDKETFEATLGKLHNLMMRAQDLRQLKAIKVIADSRFDQQTMASVSRLIKEREYLKGDSILTEGVRGLAALFIVREGKVQISRSTKEETDIKQAGDYFAEEQLLVDAQAGNKHQRPASATPSYSATVLEDCKVGVLAVEDLRKVLDTVFIGRSQAPVRDSMIDGGIRLEQLQRIRMLGAGTFGQVWLVSRVNSRKERVPYALKIQAKYELCQDGQAEAVVNEKNIMAKLDHPFLIKLMNSYQDEDFVYMVMQLVQGGELYNVIHTKTTHGVPEDHARFYAAVIAEGLGYMHRRGYVYRDLKPENVLINAKGYPVIIDFGFAKYVDDKTFTLCGTPLYLAPEVVSAESVSFYLLTMVD